MIALRLVLAAISALFGLLLILPVIVAGLPFWTVGVLTRAIAQLLEPRFASWEELIEFDQRFGWKPTPNLDTYHLADDLFRVTTDAEGWRGQHTTISESQLIVLGDSFAWGYGVDDKNFFAHLNPDLGIKTIGTVGYNMVQELLWLRELSSQFKGKLVVWFIYLGNDLYENLVPDMCGYRTPFVREVNGAGDWEIVASHISPTKWPIRTQARPNGRDYYAKLAELCSPTFLSQRAYAACEFLIRKGIDICNNVGAQLAVVTIPEQTQLTKEGIAILLSRGGDRQSFDPDYSDNQIREICRKLAIPFVALKDQLSDRDYKKHDCHWNRSGHRRVAQVLSFLHRDWASVRSKRTSSHPIANYAKVQL